MDNEQRIESVREFLEQFADEMGLDPAADGDGPVTVAGDMICNILHWVAQQGDGHQDALAAARSGLAHFATEQHIDYDAEEADELGPDAFVTIEIECDGDTWRSQTGDLIDAE